MTPIRSDAFLQSDGREATCDAAWAARSMHGHVSGMKEKVLEAIHRP